MSEQVTVRSFAAGKPWSSSDGKINLTFFETVFDRSGSDFTANWGKKAGEPKVGESIEGEFFQKNGEWRFRIASKPQGGGSSGDGSKRTWQPESQYDPERTARITRSHSQKMAVRALTAMGTFESKSADQLYNTLQSWIDWFEQDVAKAGQKAVQGAGDRDGSPPSGNPAPGQPSASDERDLHQLLETSGVNSAAARVIANYVDSEFSPEQRGTAIDRLSDPNQQAVTTGKLKTLAEKFFGEPLPTDDPDEDVPF